MSQPGKMISLGDKETENNTANEIAEENELLLRQEIAALKQVIRRGMHKKLELDDLPLDMQDNQEVVIEAIQTRAVSWRNLPSKWKDNADVTCTALELHRAPPGASLAATMFFEPGRTGVKWNDVPPHLRTNEKVLATALGVLDGAVWDDVPKTSRDNPEIILSAFRFNMINFDDIPSYLCRNHRGIAFLCVQRDLVEADECASCLFDDDFLLQAIESGKLEWSQLPSNLRENVDLANRMLRNVTITCTDKTAGRMNVPTKRMNILAGILGSFPVISADQSFWRHHLLGPTTSQSQGNLLSYEEFSYLFGRLAPTEIREDREFMLEMCYGNARVFQFAHASLTGDIDFLRQALGKNVEILKLINHETQLLYPDFIKSCLPALGTMDPLFCHNICKAIHPSFWLQRDFAMEWICAGLGIPCVLSPELEQMWLNDRGIALASIKTSGFIYARMSPLLFDEDFMAEALGCHPHLYRCQTFFPQNDPWLFTIALAGSAEFAKKDLLDLHRNGKDNEIDAIRSYLRARLSTFETFSRYVLGNMLSTQIMKDTGSPLTLLNQGTETTLVLKKSLAGYVGIPTGKTLSLLRSAEKHVNDAIAVWTQND